MFNKNGYRKSDTSLQVIVKADAQDHILALDDWDVIAWAVVGGEETIVQRWVNFPALRARIAYCDTSQGDARWAGRR